MEYHQFSAPMDEQSENWPIDLKLFHPIPEYLFLHEKANCISVEAILKMCGLSFEIEYRPNAEYMSPTGDVPFIKTGNTLISGIEAIIDFAKSYDKSFTKRTEEIERDTRVYMNHFHQVLTDAELYFIWCHEKIVQEYTYPRYVSKYPWPLSSILYYSKKRNITKRIKSGSEPITNYDEAIRRVECELENLSKLMVGPYFFGDSPTEFDALIFGHLTAIQTTALPDDALSIITRENEAIYNLCGLIGARYFPGLLLTKET